MQDTPDNPRSSSADPSGVGAETSESDEPGGRLRRPVPDSELPVRLEIEDVSRALAPKSLRWLRAIARRAIDVAISLPEERLGLTAADPFQHTTMTPHPHPASFAIESRGAALDHQVRIAVVDDERMAEMHERHSGVPGTTDVLTFDMRDDREGPLDVDIVVCIDEARRQAAERGHGIERELLLYMLHGVLHCLGHDDRDEHVSAVMHQREDEILAAIGVGAIYASTGSDAEPPEVRVVAGGVRESQG
ncbi:MAG: rRNA maturation RNase YbeY [Phycisphaeraceae bacterium]|nr:MAG: rRNA maturation RNase YbeY [Phycisphaeraceae bacterium]